MALHRFKISVNPTIQRWALELGFKNPMSFVWCACEDYHLKHMAITNSINSDTYVMAKRTPWHKKYRINPSTVKAGRPIKIYYVEKDSATECKVIFEDLGRPNGIETMRVPVLAIEPSILKQFLPEEVSQ